MFGFFSIQLPDVLFLFPMEENFIFSKTFKFEYSRRVDKTNSLTINKSTSLQRYLATNAARINNQATEDDILNRLYLWQVYL